MAPINHSRWRAFRASRHSRGFLWQAALSMPRSPSIFRAGDMRIFRSGLAAGLAADAMLVVAFVGVWSSVGLSPYLVVGVGSVIIVALVGIASSKPPVIRASGVLSVLVGVPLLFSIGIVLLIAGALLLTSADSFAAVEKKIRQGS